MEEAVVAPWEPRLFPLSEEEVRLLEVSCLECVASGQNPVLWHGAECTELAQAKKLRLAGLAWYHTQNLSLARLGSKLIGLSKIISGQVWSDRSEIVKLGSTEPWKVVEFPTQSQLDPCGPILTNFTTVFSI